MTKKFSFFSYTGNSMQEQGASHRTGQDQGLLCTPQFLMPQLVRHNSG